MKLYIIRHGETDYNQKKILQGKTNIPLNQTGIDQALKLKEKLKNISFDIVISSPLKRAIETASLIAPSQTIKIDARLEERDLGDYEGKAVKNYTKQKKIYENYFENCTLGSVEGIQDLMKRVQEMIQELRSAYPEKTVLLVSHAGWINAFVHTLKPIPESGDLEWFELGNAEYLEYNI